MPIFDLFSKRRDDIANAGKADLYQYESIPAKLRVQISQIAVDGIGHAGYYGDNMMRADENNGYWEAIENAFLREKGLRRLANGRLSGERVLTYMDDCDTDDWLDLCELTVRAIKVIGEGDQYRHRQSFNINSSSDDLISEINYRFNRAGVGYQIEDHQIIRVDNRYAHAEIVKPALALLDSKDYSGALDEFSQAHKAYRDGDSRQALVMAANAVESTLKSIFDQKRWEYQKGARISDLIKVARRHGLWPDYMDGSFDQLAATLQSGLPKIRDNDGAHGQGAAVKEVPTYVASYALHLAASKILFLINSAKYSAG